MHFHPHAWSNLIQERTLFQREAVVGRQTQAGTRTGAHCRVSMYQKYWRL